MNKIIKKLDKYFRQTYLIPTFVKINYINDSETKNVLEKYNDGRLNYRLDNGVLGHEFDVLFKGDRTYSDKKIAAMYPRIAEVSEELNLNIQQLFILDSIAHELVHVEQLISGRYSIEKRDGILSKKWLNKDITNIDYNDDPHEKEAFEKSIEVVRGFLLDVILED